MKQQMLVCYSEDENLKAIVNYLVLEDRFEVIYAENGLIMATESYDGRSLRYHEDAAENYVNGIKKLESQVSEM